MSRAPHPTSWKKFIHYAQHVKFLDLLSWDQWTNVDSIKQLGLHRPILLLFPNARVINCNDSNASFSEFLFLFLGPKLEKLNLSILNSEHFEGALQSLDCTCPLLQELRINLDTRLFDPNQSFTFTTNNVSLSSALLGLSYLKCVVVPYGLSLEVIAHLAQLPSFHLFKGGLTGEKLVSAQAAWNPCIFPDLEELCISVPRLTIAFCDLISQMESTRFHSLSLRVGQQPSSEQLDLFFTALDRPRQQATLKKLFLEFKVPREQRTGGLVDPDKPLSLDAILQPLSHFHQLENLYIRFPGLEIDSAGLRRISAAMPDLAFLELLPSRFLGPGYIPKCSLRDIVQLTRDCSKLQRIAIPFDARSTRQNQVPVLSDLTSPTNALSILQDHPDYKLNLHLLEQMHRPSRSITLGSVGFCPMDNPNTVALYLAAYWINVNLLVEHRLDSELTSLSPRDRESYHRQMDQWIPVIDRTELCMAARRSTTVITLVENLDIFGAGDKVPGKLHDVTVNQ